MILQCLVSLFDRLQSDPKIYDGTQAAVAPPGYSSQKIIFEVVIEPDGSLHAIQKVYTSADKKDKFRQMIVPGTGKSSGSGINPNFLWDRPDYMLGYSADKEKLDRAIRSFESFRERHLAAEKAVPSPEFHAICQFLRKWSPESISDEHKALLGLAVGGLCVFRARGADHFVHEAGPVKDYWETQSPGGEADAARGMCLVTGVPDSPLARLHEPKIKGVRGAQSAGSLLVSFNNKAFDSYGHEQSYNSPVGQRAAFAYCTALNYLLRQGSRQKLQVADTTVTFWTESPSDAEDMLAALFEQPYFENQRGEEDAGAARQSPSEDLALKIRLRTALGKIARGQYPGELGSPDTAFYVLGLAPNNARIVVRFWREGSLGELVDHVGQHIRDLSILGRDGIEAPSVHRILAETAREEKDIPPLLSGALMRAVLEGTPYPIALFQAVLRRTRADHTINAPRAATLKATLNRASRRKQNPLTREVSMSLDTTRPEPSYHFGRLFAALEKAQEDALPGLNDTIKDRYFGAAMSTPASVFPRLIRLNQHHLGKLERGWRVNAERRIQDIASRLDGFPTHMGLTDQGLFAIGYYHQRQELFKRKDDDKSTGDASAATDESPVSDA